MAEYCDTRNDVSTDIGDNIAGEHIDAPFDANQSLSEQMQERYPDWSIDDGTTEQLQPGHQDVELFEFMEDLGCGFQEVRDQKNAREENKDLNNALNQTEIADNCDPPQNFDVGMDLNDI